VKILDITAIDPKLKCFFWEGGGTIGATGVFKTEEYFYLCAR
jgi:hypothetical protein